MKRNEIIELTYTWLKKFNYMKEQIKWTLWTGMDISVFICPYFYTH